MTALGLFTFCGLSYLISLQSLQHRKVELGALAVAQPSRVQIVHKDSTTHLNTQLASFYLSFPIREEMPAQVESLFGAAEKHNLVLENGSYELVRGDAHKLTKCEVQLPLKGTYAQTREFVSNVLANMPNAALHNINIQRQKTGDSTVDSQIRLTLYYRDT